jgi:hypothetical protein
VWPALAARPGAGTETLCRDYLELTDEAAGELGPLHFEAAAKTWISVSRKRETALELLNHRRQDVRGRAILECLAHSNQHWAFEALADLAPHALAYRIPK